MKKTCSAQNQENVRPGNLQPHSRTSKLILRCVPVDVNVILLNMVEPLDRCVPVCVNGIMLNMVAPLDSCVPVSVKGIMLNMVAPLDRCVPALLW